ncbi:MAG: RNA polymerase sigma factor [Bacteroidia bacterium]
MATTSLHDTELLDRARRGDQTAFGQLVQRYQARVAATVIGMLGPGEDAEDVGQEVFIRFYRSLDQYRGEAALATYLTRIAINLSLNALKRRRRRQRWQRLWGDSAVPDLPDPAQDNDRDDDRALLEQGLRRLDPDARAVITLRLIEGYSTQETADLLGIKLGTVLSRLSRAQEKLRQILDKPAHRQRHQPAG